MIKNISIIILIAAGLQVRAQLPTDFIGRSEKDPRTRVYLPPVRILWQSDSRGISLQGTKNLLNQGNGQAELINRNLVVMKSDSLERPGFVVDFGKEIHGGLQIVTGYMKSRVPAKVRIRFGESVSEVMSDIGGTTGATNDHAMRDFVISLPWLGTMEVGNTGFRFVRIDLLDQNVELLLKELRAVLVYRDIPYLGSFRSSDEKLNQIWATGAYTVHLNMQQYLWDGIKRDRLVWVGDMHPEVMTISSVFGNNDVVPKSLDLIRDVTPLPAWMNGISSYSMWWIRIQRDWYYYQGNLTYLRSQKTYLKGLLNQLMSKVENNEEVLDGWRFLDWPSSKDKAAIHAGLQAMLVLTLQAGVDLSKALGDHATAEKCSKTISSLKKATLPAGTSKQAAALMALADLMPASDANKIIAADGTKDFSTFYGYYMLQAKAKAGDYQGAITNIGDYWGGMLDMGATTFWEDFDLEWKKNASPIDQLVREGTVDLHATYGKFSYSKLRHSLCHGWASGPTPWLTEHVLGISIVSPGCRVIRVRPHLGNLRFVEGTFPTPFGVVKVKHTRLANGEVRSDIQAPKQVRVVR